MISMTHISVLTWPFALPVLAKVDLFLCFVLLNRFQEKGNLEVLLFTIQSRMRANNQRVYTPKEGALVADINRVRGQMST